ncbi:MAG: DUF4185 domain-containing protein [Proteobacteria bacterium]|nr:DUF4185 domain-containing protein [Pseudomonadota bacterium]
MRKLRNAILFAAAIAALPAAAHASTPALIGSSTKVCQLTGETDWLTNQPTDAKTLSQFGLDAVDLGFPVDSAPGPLYLLFGDAWQPHHPPGSPADGPPDDALGITARTAVPDAKTCLDMKLAMAAPQFYASPTVVPPVQQGFFNVPTGGIFLDKSFYGFFWINHCVLPTVLAPDPSNPLSLPAPNPPNCFETTASNSVGRNVIARATPADPVTFHRIAGPPALIPLPPVTMPSGFIYVSAAEPPPDKTPRILVIAPPIPVFGVPRYRASVPYLALAPRATFANPMTWKFFAGFSAGNPVWVTRQQWESGQNASGQWVPPPGAEILSPVPAGERCIGEHSVTFNAALQAWLMLYNCGPWQIEARTAPKSWGPWSDPIVLLSLTHDPSVVCTIIMNITGCGPNQRNYWPVNGSNFMPGFFYAPFVMNRYTQSAVPGPGQTHAATIYWLLSTWNPYDVIVMKSQIGL